jgi:hypothetical protein
MMLGFRLDGACFSFLSCSSDAGSVPVFVLYVPVACADLADNPPSRFAHIVSSCSAMDEKKKTMCRRI